MAVGDVYEADIQYHVHERPLHLGLWFQVITDPSNVYGTADDLAQAIYNGNLWSLLASLISNEARGDQIRCYKRLNAALGIENGPVGRLVLANEVGARIGEALPDNAPLQINWLQSAISSKANGRAFLSGVSEDDTGQNVLTAAFRAGDVAAFEADWPVDPAGIVGPFGGAYRQVVMSKHPDAGGTPLDTYGVPIDVTSVSVAPIIRQQRRRQTRWEGVSF